jgi:hypothetical protein
VEAELKKEGEIENTMKMARDDSLSCLFTFEKDKKCQVPSAKYYDRSSGARSLMLHLVGADKGSDKTTTNSNLSHNINLNHLLLLHIK